MTLQELSDKEDALYRKVIDLYHQPRSSQADETLHDIFLEYREIHQAYADLSQTDYEALKRGLFIQWYALAEPSYLTGIADLDENAENKIIQSLSNLIEAGKADNELIWMLNHYFNWEWIFERLTSFKGFNREIMNENNNHLPDNVDREEMEQRGQMGKYWNSLTKFRDT
jgi:hypothetical protein